MRNTDTEVLKFASELYRFTVGRLMLYGAIIIIAVIVVALVFIVRYNVTFEAKKTETTEIKAAAVPSK